MGMKAKLLRFVLAGLVACLGVSCTTAYDAYGYPQEVVDPGVAIAGAAAVGLLAYGLASSNNNDCHYPRYSNYNNCNYPRYRSYNRGYYRPSGCDTGYIRPPVNCW